jgi:integrase
MASVIDDPNGRRRVMFVAPDGKRKAVRLGKVDRRAAESFARRVELILSATITKTAIDADTARWVAELPDAAYAKLAAVGLATARGAAQLGPWLDGFLAERTDLKPATVRLYRKTRRALLDHFAASQDMRTITREQASAWHAALVARGLANATVRTHVVVARLFLNAAVTRELVARNPFDHLVGGSTPTKNERYLSPADAGKVLDELPAGDARTMFALCRYAGLRCPSETHNLRWSDIDWLRGRMNVRSPKTERHAGHEQRPVPITPALLPFLREAFDAAEPGQVHVLASRGSETTQRDRIAAAVTRAGVEPWADMYRILRSSCEREWAMTFPQYAVSKWIGHSIAVSGKHYAHHVPDELFDKAAHNQAQLAQETVGNQRNSIRQPIAAAVANSDDFLQFPGSSAECKPLSAKDLGNRCSPRDPGRKTGRAAARSAGRPRGSGEAGLGWR